MSKKLKVPAEEFRPKKHKKLSLMMARFAQEWLLDKDSRKAAIRAGYSARTAHATGFKLFWHPAVQEEILRLQEEVIENYTVTHQMITNELFKMAFTDMNDFVEIIENGTGDSKVQEVVFKPTSALKKGSGKAIKTLEIGRRGIKLQLVSKESALEMLAKHTGYFGVDNRQKTPQGVMMYIPDNNRGDVIEPEKEDEAK